eukprot:6431427-Amphidinium_carterae.1
MGMWRRSCKRWRATRRARAFWLKLIQTWQTSVGKGYFNRLDIFGEPLDDYVMLHKVPMALRSDRDFVLAAVTLDGRNLQHAAEHLQDDQDIAEAAVRQNGVALLDVSERLREDRSFILLAVSRLPERPRTHLEYPTLPLWCRADREIMQAALEGDDLKLMSYVEVLSSELLLDPEFVPEAKDHYIILRVALLSGAITGIAIGCGLCSIHSIILQCCHQFGIIVGGRERLIHGTLELQPQEHAAVLFERGIITELTLIVG